MEEKEKVERNQVFYPGEACWIVEEGSVHLVGSHCKKCGQNYFPSREICPHCFAEREMEKLIIGNRGKLYSFSIVQVAPKRFMPPYALGYIDFSEGVRVLGQLTTIELAELKLDMEVQTELGRIAIDEHGNEVISYKFRPV